MEKIKDSEGKIFRILKIIKRLEQKEVLNGENLANEFNVDIKTIQRDIKTLKDYLFEESDPNKATSCCSLPMSNAPTSNTP